MIYIYLLFVTYSCLAGIVEAILYGRKGAESFKWNEHVFYIAKAGVVLGGLLIAQYLPELNILGTLLCFIACVFSYPFFHDGFYYETARRINRPDYRFNSNSKTSTAKIEVPWFLRVNMLFVSLIIVLVDTFLL